MHRMLVDMWWPHCRGLSPAILIFVATLRRLITCSFHCGGNTAETVIPAGYIVVVTLQTYRLIVALWW